MKEIDAIQNKRESKIISSINNDTSENGYIVFDYREKSGYRNYDTHDCFRVRNILVRRTCKLCYLLQRLDPFKLAEMVYVALFST